MPYNNNRNRWRHTPLLVLLASLMSPVLAQQPQAVDRDPHTRVETRDPSVNAVNPDPANPGQDPQNLNLYLGRLTQGQQDPKQDAPAQQHVLPAFATWGPRPQPQTVSSDFASRARPASSWGQNNLPVDELTLLEQNTEQQGASQVRVMQAATAGENATVQQWSLRSGQSHSGQPGVAQLGLGQPPLGQLAQPGIFQARTALSGSLSLPQSSGYPNTLSPASALAGEFQATSVDFAAPLIFDPAKMMAVDHDKAKRRLEESQSQSQSAGAPECRTPATLQAKLRCVQSQQKKDHKADPQSELSLPQ